MLCKALYYRILEGVLIFGVFQTKNEFRDFEGQEMRFKYDCVVAFLVFFVFFLRVYVFFVNFFKGGRFFVFRAICVRLF